MNTALIEPSVDYLRVETHVIVTCPDCGQTDCDTATATATAERLGRQIAEQRELEHSLAATFTTMQRERVPGKRQELWAECLRLAKALEGLTNE